MKERKPIFSNLNDACRCVGIEANSRGGSGFIAANIADDRHGRGDGRIKYFEDGSGGLAWNWKTDEKALFFYDHREGQKVGRAVIEARKEEARRRYEIQTRQTAERQNAVAALAAQIMQASRPSVNHPYLRRKHVLGFEGAPSREIDRDQVQAMINAAAIPYQDGSRQYLGYCERRLLCVPITDGNGKLWTIQFIDTRGRKSFLKGGRIKGLMWFPEDFGRDPERLESVALCEGVATALSVRRLYRVPCMAGIFAGNLKAAALTLRAAFPRAPIWVCADRDANQTGEKAAREAACFVPNSRLFVCPEFTATELANFRKVTGGDKPTDYNDLMVAKGL